MCCLCECEEDFAVFTKPAAGSVIFEDRIDPNASDASPEESADQSVADTHGVGITGDVDTHGVDVSQETITGDVDTHGVDVNQEAITRRVIPKEYVDPITKRALTVPSDAQFECMKKNISYPEAVDLLTPEFCIAYSGDVLPSRIVNRNPVYGTNHNNEIRFNHPGLLDVFSKDSCRRRLLRPLKVPNHFVMENEGHLATRAANLCRKVCTIVCCSIHKALCAVGNGENPGVVNLMQARHCGPDGVFVRKDHGDTSRATTASTPLHDRPRDTNLFPFVSTQICKAAEAMKDELSLGSIKRLVRNPAFLNSLDSSPPIAGTHGAGDWMEEALSNVPVPPVVGTHGADDGGLSVTHVASIIDKLKPATPGRSPMGALVTERVKGFEAIGSASRESSESKAARSRSPRTVPSHANRFSPDVPQHDDQGVGTHGADAVVPAPGQPTDQPSQLTASSSSTHEKSMVIKGSVRVGTHGADTDLS